MSAERAERIRLQGMEHYGFGPEAMKKLKVCTVCGASAPKDRQFCTECGHKNSGAGKFCPECGAKRA